MAAIGFVNGGETNTSNESGNDPPLINPSEFSRPTSLQRIAQRKSQYRNYTRRKKLEKLGFYSSCKAEDSCKCNGWKNPNLPPTPARVDASQPLASLKDPCRSCNHTLGSHISHLRNKSEDELNRLLCMVVDVENLFTCVHKEEDADTKHVYFYFFKLLRKCILQMSTPVVEGPFGSPPFETPNIAKAVLNFVLYKFGHLPQREWQIMRYLAKMFLHCLNHWKLETPTMKKQHSQGEDMSAYKVNYTRWLCYCHVPLFCDSLPKYGCTAVFGRTLLRSVFSVMRRQLLEKFRAEKDKMPPDKRTIVLTHFPRFLSMLEEEIYGDSSPIWDDNLTVPQSVSMNASSSSLLPLSSLNTSSSSVTTATTSASPGPGTPSPLSPVGEETSGNSKRTRDNEIDGPNAKKQKLAGVDFLASRLSMVSTSLLGSTDDVEDRIRECENNLQFLQTQYSGIIAELEIALTCKICFQLIQGCVAFLQCCSQIAGCGQCVQTWFEENDTCPLCRDPNGVDKVIPFRGLDDVLNKTSTLL